MLYVLVTCPSISCVRLSLPSLWYSSSILLYRLLTCRFLSCVRLPLPWPGYGSSVLYMLLTCRSISCVRLRGLARVWFQCVVHVTHLSFHLLCETLWPGPGMAPFLLYTFLNCRCISCVRLSLSWPGFWLQYVVYITCRCIACVRLSLTLPPMAPVCCICYSPVVLSLV